MKTTKNAHYLITGNSAGGIAAAEAIRELDRENTIAMVTDEPYIAYSRPLISEYLANPCDIEHIAFRQPDFYEKNGIELLTGKAVTGINTGEKTATLSGGQAVNWEKLLLATGGTPIVPNMEGNRLNGVFTFNKLDDAKAIDAFLQRRHRRTKAVVIGGGLIGASVTEALLNRNVNVVIVEMQDRILSAMLDPEASAIEAEALKQAGVTLMTERTVTAINQDLRGEISHVTMADGEIVYCDMVITAIGVKPRLDAVQGSGIAVNRGITVNGRMETSVPGVYACGDAAEAYDFIHGENRLTPVWPNAFEGGRTAGLNMAGGEAEYAGGTAMNAMKYFGQRIVSAGMVNPPENGYETLKANNGRGYRKVVLHHGKIAGLVFAGDISRAGIIYGLMKSGANVSGYKHLLVADNFSLASLPRKVWRERLAGPSTRNIDIITLPEEAEEAVIGD